MGCWKQAIGKMMATEIVCGAVIWHGMRRGEPQEWNAAHWGKRPKQPWIGLSGSWISDKSYPGIRKDVLYTESECAHGTYDFCSSYSCLHGPYACPSAWPNS